MKRWFPLLALLIATHDGRVKAHVPNIVALAARTAA